MMILLLGTIVLSSVLSTSMAYAHSQNTTSNYHENDKEGLRRFLRQPSGEKGKLNLEKTGLSISDTLTWNTSEEWIKKIAGISWSDDITNKRITAISFKYIKLAGILDCRLFTELNKLQCNNNQLNEIDLTNCSQLTTLDCYNNQLTNMSITNCSQLKTLSCYTNRLTELKTTGCTNLNVLHCQNNKLAELELTNCINMTFLSCYNNQLSVLNASKCSNLSTLHCQNK